ncbi:hypothetical protein JJE00_04680 [Candidatus Bathyarchaeota archaeon]|nr:hypothetical protein [Candidatus Bathyarchaeota archaeon]
MRNLLIISTVFPPLAIAAGIVSGFAGGVSILSLKDLIEKRETIEELQRKPVAMLFDAKQKASNS